MGDCSDILYEDFYKEDLKDKQEFLKKEKIRLIEELKSFHKKENTKTSWDYVLEDIAKREKMGYNKYGKYLTVNTDEDMLNHAYNEALDLVVYLRTLLLQRGKDYDPNL